MYYCQRGLLQCMVILEVRQGVVPRRVVLCLDMHLPAWCMNVIFGASSGEFQDDSEEGILRRNSLEGIDVP